VAAQRAGIAVVPVTLHGTRAVFPDGAWAAHHHSVRLHIDAPIHAMRNTNNPSDPNQPYNAFIAAVALRDATREAMLHDLSKGRESVAAKPPLNPQNSHTATHV
jgi:1-acyl-sn-glycerol-3-phosphate acyltransferase